MLKAIRNRIQSEILYIKEHSDDIITAITVIVFVGVMWFFSVALLPIK